MADKFSFPTNSKFPTSEDFKNSSAIVFEYAFVTLFLLNVKRGVLEVG